MVNLFLGNQEYSSRWAGITAGIILAVLIPLVLILVYIGYRFFKAKKAAEEEEDLTRQSAKIRPRDDEFEPLPTPKETDVD